MEGDQIGIIFCTSKAMVDEISLRFTKCRSHADLPTPERGHNEAEWQAGHKRWIAATRGLIHRIDHPNIGTVIFVGLSFGLLNLYQGAGQGGRDGRRLWAILIDVTSTVQIPPSDISADQECLTEGLGFLVRKDCRRLIMSETLDGTSIRYGDITNVHLCDHCDPTSPIVAGITPILRDPPPPIPSAAAPNPVAAASMDCMEGIIQPDELRSLQRLHRYGY